MVRLVSVYRGRRHITKIRVTWWTRSVTSRENPQLVSILISIQVFRLFWNFWNLKRRTNGEKWWLIIVAIVTTLTEKLTAADSGILRVPSLSTETTNKVIRNIISTNTIQPCLPVLHTTRSAITTTIIQPFPYHLRLLGPCPSVPMRTAWPVLVAILCRFIRPDDLHSTLLHMRPESSPIRITKISSTFSSNAITCLPKRYSFKTVAFFLNSSIIKRNLGSVYGRIRRRLRYLRKHVTDGGLDGFRRRWIYLRSHPCAGIFQLFWLICSIDGGGSQYTTVFGRTSRAALSTVGLQSLQKEERHRRPTQSCHNERAATPKKSKFKFHL